MDPEYWRGRRILLTGHTGFKGAWAALLLHRLGAHIYGLALPPDQDPNLFDLARIAEVVSGSICDLCEARAVRDAVAAADPEIVLHLAAQPLVRRSMAEPAATFATNVMGTVNLLEALRTAANLKAVLIVTTDKVYSNPETGRPFREDEPLGGDDPYSASKAAVEIATRSYAKCFFEDRGIPVGTARAGNVIGGGDFSADRIVPDAWRAQCRDEPLVLRYPAATRPWLYVLDCLCGYLTYISALSRHTDAPRALNFGPDPSQSLPVKDLVERFQSQTGARHGWRLAEGFQGKEMHALALDSTCAREALGWRNHLDAHQAIAATAGWYLAQRRGEDPQSVCLNAIEAYLKAP